MSTYNFSTQKELFEIAFAILEDYNINEWSFGGGTALSCCYYNHRMSYDIDIFSEDYSAIGRLIENIVYELKRDKVMKLIGKGFITYEDILGLNMNDLKELI